MAIEAPQIAPSSAEELLAEAKRLIPRYCPGWTHLDDADPGVTLLQLVAWMTEVGTRRLNRLPDRLHAHFLSLLGERRRPAVPARVDLCLRARAATVAPEGTVCLAQDDDGGVLRFLTCAPVLASDARVVAATWVEIGASTMARALTLCAAPTGAGVVVVDAPGPGGLDPCKDGEGCRVDRVELALELAEPVPMAGRLAVVGDGGDLTELFDWCWKQGESVLPLDVDGSGAPVVTQGSPGAALVGVARVTRFLAGHMARELDVSWVDDRSHQALPVPGLQVGFDASHIHLRLRGLPLGQQPGVLCMEVTTPRLRLSPDAQLPALRWQVRRGGHWEGVPESCVEVKGWSTRLRFSAGAGMDGTLELRAERVGRVYLDALLPSMSAEVCVSGFAPLHLASGGGDGRGAPVDVSAFPWSPFQALAGLKPDPTCSLMMGSAWALCGEALVVTLDLELDLPSAVGVIWEARTARGWVAVGMEEGPERLGPEVGLALADGRRRVAWRLRACREVVRCDAGGAATGWLRVRLTPLSEVDPSPTAPWRLDVVDVSLRAAERGAGEALRWRTSSLATGVESGGAHPRFDRVFLRCGDGIEVGVDASEPLELEGPGHRALYLRFDPPLPQGGPHRLALRGTGGRAVPDGAWEALVCGSWTRVGDPTRSGAELPSPCAWMRVRWEENAQVPAVVRVDLGCVDAVNLHGVVERVSPLGTPGERLQLARPPVYGGDDPRWRPGLAVHPSDGQGWRCVEPAELHRHARGEGVFALDPAEGTIEVGAGPGGRTLPAREAGVEVRYFHVPGRRGGVPAGAVQAVEGLDGVEVCNPEPARGGVDAERLEDAMRRAPDVLSGPARAVTSRDLEQLARDADPGVARAHCEPPSLDGRVQVVIVPSPGTTAAGVGALSLAQRVQRYLLERCVMGVEPEVRVATQADVAVEVDVRWWPGRRDAEAVEAWVRRYLDPWTGGPAGGGVGLGAGLDARDLGRVVTEVAAVRHVVRARLAEVGSDLIGGRTITLASDALPRVVSVRVRDAEGAP